LTKNGERRHFDSFKKFPLQLFHNIKCAAHNITIKVFLLAVVLAIHKSKKETIDMLKHFIRVFTLILILMLSFALTACGSNNAPADTSSASPSESVTDTASPSDTASAEASPSADTSVDPSTEPSASASASAKDTSGLTTYSGYLVDQKTAATGKDASGNVLKKNPKKVSVKVLRNSTHADSGYGIYMMRKDGTYKYFKLDTTGSSMVKRYIVDKTKRTSSVLIAVRGTLSGSTIKVSSVLQYGLK
jgi:hypothetical protein